MTVEYNAVEDELKRAVEVNRRLSAELAAEKTTGRQRLEQKEKEAAEKMKELEKSAEKRLTVSAFRCVVAAKICKMLLAHDE